MSPDRWISVAGPRFDAPPEVVRGALANAPTDLTAQEVEEYIAKFLSQPAVAEA
jgi:hypothetical protein